MPLTFTDTLEPERVRWLWPGYIPFGKVTVLDGDPGLGKSTILIDLAARLSRGCALPNGKQHRPMGTVLLMGEDGARDTIVPRLINAEADRAKVAIRDTYPSSKAAELPPSFPADLDRLKQDILDATAGMVVIDPVMSYLDADINSNNDQQVRRALMPLATLAEETGAAIVMLRHLNKSAGGNALYRGGGSIGFVGVSRSALVLARDPDEPGRVVLASNKSNLGPPPPSLHFRLVGCDNGAARIAWEGHSLHTAATLLDQGNDEERGALGEAVAFLRAVLADGPELAKVVQRQARDAQIADRTLRRAREALGIRQDTPYIRRATTQHGQFTWELPPAPEATRGGQPSPLATLDNLANIKQPRQKSGTDEGGQGSGCLDNLANIENQKVKGGINPEVDSLNLYLSNNLNSSINYLDVGQLVQPVQAQRLAKFSPADSFPVVAKTGSYECANGCGRRQYMVEGSPQLCRTCRAGLGLFRTGAD